MKQVVNKPAEDTVILFEEGVIGVPGARRFELLERPDSTVRVLRCLDIEGFNLPVVDPRLADESYTPEFGSSVAEMLQLEPDEPLLMLAVTALASGGPMLANLRAPVVVNVRNRLAVQVILDGDYPLRAPVAPVGTTKP